MSRQKRGIKINIILLVILFLLWAGLVVAWYAVYREKQSLSREFNDNRAPLSAEAVVRADFNVEFDDSLFNESAYQSLTAPQVLPVTVKKRGRENPFAFD